jgi:uncharacterized repeat protein (TIGR01451 family)
MSTSATAQDTVCYSALLDPLAGDSTPGTNQYTVCSRIVNSFDPNDKSVSPPDGMTLAQAQAGEFLYYTVRFQNTGTADAVNIEVGDTLSALLDLSSFRMLDASHPLSWSLHAGSHVLKVKFLDINLPDSNANEPLSHGYFTYRIKTKQGIGGGSQIMNSAAIYFDFNPPVITNTTITNIFSPVSVQDLNRYRAVFIHPNPATTNLLLKCPEGRITRATIFSVTGKLLGETNSSARASVDIDISYLARGMYFIKVETDKGTVLGRFVKE